MRHIRFTPFTAAPYHNPPSPLTIPIYFIYLSIPLRQLPVIIKRCRQPESHQLIKYGCELFQLNSRLVLSTFPEPTIDNCERDGESSRASIEWCARVAAQLFAPSAEYTSCTSQVPTPLSWLATINATRPTNSVLRNILPIAITTVSSIFHLNFIGDCHTHPGVAG